MWMESLVARKYFFDFSSSVAILSKTTASKCRKGAVKFEELEFLIPANVYIHKNTNTHKHTNKVY